MCVFVITVFSRVAALLANRVFHKFGCRRKWLRNTDLLQSRPIGYCHINKGKGGQYQITFVPNYFFCSGTAGIF